MFGVRDAGSKKGIEIEREAERKGREAGRAKT